jgi:hypothetical protein
LITMTVRSARTRGGFGRSSVKIRGWRTTSSRAATGSPSRASVATPSRSSSLIRGLNGSGVG